MPRFFLSSRPGGFVPPPVNRFGEGTQGHLILKLYIEYYAIQIHDRSAPNFQWSKNLVAKCWNVNEKTVLQQQFKKTFFKT